MPDEVTATEKERIILGSGHLYYMEFSGTMPQKATIEAEAHRLGYISGGATIEYKPSFYEAKDDLGVVTKSIITDETATLKSGIMTINGNRLALLSPTARVTDNGSTSGTRTLKIGGIKNATNKNYVIHFLHVDDVDGDIWVDIVGHNEAGFSLSFAKDKETVVDAEFKCVALDTDGTLIIYNEEIPTESAEG